MHNLFGLPKNVYQDAAELPVENSSWDSVQPELMERRSRSKADPSKDGMTEKWVTERW